MVELQEFKLGFKENIRFIFLLVILNFFVGSMVGLERTVLPLLGEKEFGLISTSATLSFIISFGLSKAIMNLVAGHLSDKLGRKKILLIGWVIGLLVPILIINADSWLWIIVANILLGINQGLTWSMTVNMKVDVVQSKQRGLVVGLNEFAGYMGLSVIAIVSGYIASEYGLRPYPFYLGILLALSGIILTLFTKETSAGSYSRKENSNLKKPMNRSMKDVFADTTFKNKTLSSCSLVGLVTNLKDGMIWGLLAIFLTSNHLTLEKTAIIVAAYPAAWSVLQLFTGALSDRMGRKHLIVLGIMIQGFSIWGFLIFHGFLPWLLIAVILGLGTAMVYPTLQAAISDVANPEWRASSLGVYRFWRDSGYAVGAMLSGVITDIFNMNWAIGTIAVIPVLAGIVAVVRMKETLKI